MGARDPEFDALFESNFDGCFRLICRNGVPPSDAEDLTQQVFIIAHEKLRAGEPIELAGPWLRRIALNVVREYLRWRRVRLTLARYLEWTPGAAPRPSHPPDLGASDRELGRRIQATLQGMSAKLREVLVLAEFEGLRPQEIAAELGIPVNTARSRHRLAVEDFRRLWFKFRQESPRGT